MTTPVSTLTVPDFSGDEQLINTLPPLGQAGSAASLPVVIASDQTAVPVSGPLTNAQLGAAALATHADAQAILAELSGGLPVTGPLTAAQLAAAGLAMAANLPALNGDGGAAAHVTNFPASQAVTAAAGGLLDVGTGASPGANTLNGRLAALLVALGSPLQAGGAVGLSGAALSALAEIAANTVQPGLGAMQAVPAGSTNGTALGSMPAGAVGCRIYLNAGDSITFTIASSAPGSAPANTFTISGSNNQNWDENLAAGQMIYITAVNGNPKFRFV